MTVQVTQVPLVCRSSWSLGSAGIRKVCISAKAIAAVTRPASVRRGEECRARLTRGTAGARRSMTRSRSAAERLGLALVEVGERALSRSSTTSAPRAAARPAR